MAGVKFDPILGQLREKDSSTTTETFTLTEYINTDPVAPVDGVPWIKRTVILDGEVGSPRGLLLVLTYTGEGVSTYELSVKTIDSGIKRVTIA